MKEFKVLILHDGVPEGDWFVVHAETMELAALGFGSCIVNDPETNEFLMV